MQADEESGFFQIEKYTREVPTDVVTYLRKWIKLQEAHLFPATYRDYLNSINNHLIPWFKMKMAEVHGNRTHLGGY